MSTYWEEQQLICYASQPTELVVWDLNNVRAVLRRSAVSETADFTPDGQSLVAVRPDGSLAVPSLARVALAVRR